MIDANEIEVALEALFLGETSDNKFKSIDVQRGFAALTRPGLTWAVLGGKYANENGMAKDIYETFDIVGTVAVKNVASEKERRKIAHALNRYITLKLLGNKLDLDIEEIMPTKWNEVTSEEHLRAGLLLMELTFSTRAQVVPEKSGEAERRLEAIWTTYTDPSDGQTVAESKENFDNGETP